MKQAAIIIIVRQTSDGSFSLLHFTKKSLSDSAEKWHVSIVKYKYFSELPIIVQIVST